MQIRFGVGEEGILGLWLNWKMVSLVLGKIVIKHIIDVVDIPVLIDEKARPSKPSLLVSWINCVLSVSAASTACDVTVAPPTLTVSVKTLPLAELPSP